MARAPEPLVRAAAATVGEALARRPGPNRQMVERHLRRILASGDAPRDPDPDEVERMVRQAFHSYARYWMEGARLPAVPATTVLSRMEIASGYEHLKEGMASGRGVVMALPHIGSWEWGGAYLALEGYPMTTVAERLEPPEMMDYFIRQREALGLRIVPLGSGSSGELLRTLRAGGLVGLLCDRDILGGGVPVSFFGEETTFPAGPATLALRAGAVLVSAVVYSGPGLHHTGVISAPLNVTRTGSLRADVARVTQEIARHLEGHIRRAPTQWHVFQPNWPSDRAPLGR
jgi:KDO2-lipid IV(A) lauroyltransferase